MLLACRVFDGYLQRLREFMKMSFRTFKVHFFSKNKESIHLSISAKKKF